MENLVFRHLREKTQEIYFLRNGWECDFIALPMAEEPLLVQVTARLDQTTLANVIKRLEAG